MIYEPLNANYFVYKNINNRHSSIDVFH